MSAAESRPTGIAEDALKQVIKSQYHAALAMLKVTIEKCPRELWLNSTPRNAFWQIAYHALFFTHLYLQPEEAAFRPWAEHQSENQNPDGIGGPPDPASSLPVLPNPYSQEQALAYWKICHELVDTAVDAFNLHSDRSGFWWYRMSKLEHQFVNIRHIQHHAAQLADRLRNTIDAGTRWVSEGGQSRRLFHIASVGEIESARNCGTYLAPSLETEGFIHCSYLFQVCRVANERFRGRTELALMEIDPSRLQARVIEERAPEAQDDFPHIYGPVPMAAVVAVHPLHCDAAGYFQLPDSVKQ